MKLYTSFLAPNGLRVLMLAREKDIDLDVHQLEAGANKSAAYLAINPLGQVPALERDDGTCITESLAISHYLDAVSGPPFLCGDALDERTTIAMWERRAEMRLFIPAVEYGHHTHPMFEDRLARFPDWANSISAHVADFLPIMDRQLAATPFLAGDTFSIADITAYLGYRLAQFYGLEATPRPATAAWIKRVEARPAASVLPPMPPPDQLASLMAAAERQARPLPPSRTDN